MDPVRRILRDENGTLAEGEKPRPLQKRELSTDGDFRSEPDTHRELGAAESRPPFPPADPRAVSRLPNGEQLEAREVDP